jgi:hypothetical protein
MFTVFLGGEKYRVFFRRLDPKTRKPRSTTDVGLLHEWPIMAEGREVDMATSESHTSVRRHSSDPYNANVARKAALRKLLSGFDRHTRSVIWGGYNLTRKYGHPYWRLTSVGLGELRFESTDRFGKVEEPASVFDSVRVKRAA